MRQSYLCSRLVSAVPSVLRRAAARAAERHYVVREGKYHTVTVGCVSVAIHIECRPWRCQQLHSWRQWRRRRRSHCFIEYDGFKEHFTNLDKVDAYNHEDYYRPDDVERQKVLEGYGYRFQRVNRFNLGRDPVKTLDARLSKLAQDALRDAQPHEMIDEVKETAEGLISGDKRVCKTCGEVRDIEDFSDPELAGRSGRKCMPCKRTEAIERAQKASERAAKGALPPVRYGRTHRRGRAWRRW